MVNESSKENGHCDNWLEMRKKHKAGFQPHFLTKTNSRQIHSFVHPFIYSSIQYYLSTYRQQAKYWHQHLQARFLSSPSLHANNTQKISKQICTYVSSKLDTISSVKGKDNLSEALTGEGASHDKNKLWKQSALDKKKNNCIKALR